jgi:hypothetical protein
MNNSGLTYETYARGREAASRAVIGYEEKNNHR